jgi:hypothetical protein
MCFDVFGLTGYRAAGAAAVSGQKAHEAGARHCQVQRTQHAAAGTQDFGQLHVRHVTHTVSHQNHDRMQQGLP